MPEAPQPAQNRQGGEFKARLNRDIAFTIIDEQIQAGIEPAQLTGRGLAKQYGFGSPQTWVTHLKEWRQLRGLAPGSEEVKEAETAPIDDVEREGDGTPAGSEPGPNPTGGGYGMISRTEFLQHQEMWNRLLNERELAHAERLKVARMEGVQSGRDAGRQEGQALAEARELTLQERARRERLEGEREGAAKAQQELSARIGGERRLLVSLAIVVGIVVGVAIGAGAVWWALRSTPVPETQPPVVQPKTIEAPHAQAPAAVVPAVTPAVIAEPAPKTETAAPPPAAPTP